MDPQSVADIALRSRLLSTIFTSEAGAATTMGSLQVQLSVTGLPVSRMRCSSITRFATSVTSH